MYVLWMSEKGKYGPMKLTVEISPNLWVNERLYSPFPLILHPPWKVLGSGGLHSSHIHVSCESNGLRQEWLGQVTSRGERDVWLDWQCSSSYTQGLCGVGKSIILTNLSAGSEKIHELWMSEKGEYDCSLTHKLGIIYTISSNIA